jgi:CBS domain-containing protein
MAAISDAGAIPVSALVGDTVARIAPGASMSELARALADGDVGVLAVGGADDVVGIVSERDVVRALAAGKDPAGTRAIDIAHTTLLWCDATATVAETAAKMMNHYVRHVLIEDEGRLLGIVSARDLLGVYAAADMNPEG